VSPRACPGNGGARTRSQELCGLQALADAIRECLGLEPLQRPRPRRFRVSLETERFHQHEFLWENPLEDGWRDLEPTSFETRAELGDLAPSGRYFHKNPFAYQARERAEQRAGRVAAKSEALVSLKWRRA
jgi:hypothetical protein